MTGQCVWLQFAILLSGTISLCSSASGSSSVQCTSFIANSILYILGVLIQKNRTMIVLPVAIYRVFFDTLNVADEFVSPSVREQRLFEARGISLAVLFGCLAFFWIPLAVWKLIVSFCRTGVMETCFMLISYPPSRILGPTSCSCANWPLGPCGRGSRSSWYIVICSGLDCQDTWCFPVNLRT